jgi:hypothetical protein
LLEQSQPEEFLDGICTQADVVRFLAENTALLRKEPLFQRRYVMILHDVNLIFSLAELNLAQRKPYVLPHDAISGQAFIEMVCSIHLLDSQF